MLTEMLDTPIAELTMSDEVDVGNDFFNGRSLFFLNAVLEDVLNHQATCLTKGHLVPHTSKCIVDFCHDLRWLFTPSKLEELLPDMTGISMDDSVWDSSEQLADHVSFVALRNRVEGLLDDVAAERVHAERDDVAVDSISNSNDLIGRAMLEAPLDKEIAKAIDH